MPHEITAFGRREQLQRRGDQRAHVIERAWSRGAHERSQFREREFDAIEVGIVAWQVQNDSRLGRALITDALSFAASSTSAGDQAPARTRRCD